MATLMVTGHRKLVPPGWTGNPYPDNNEIVSSYHNAIYNTIYRWCYSFNEYHMNFCNKPTVFISGMAIGADQIFAQAILQLKKDGVPCKLLAAVPFKGQESKWVRSAIIKYNDILSKCDDVIYVNEPGYAAWKMQARNQWMVDWSSDILMVWNGIQNGGTWNCIKYASTKIINKYHLSLNNLTISAV